MSRTDEAVISSCKDQTYLPVITQEQLKAVLSAYLSERCDGESDTRNFFEAIYQHCDGIASPVMQRFSTLIRNLKEFIWRYVGGKRRAQLGPEDTMDVVAFLVEHVRHEIEFDGMFRARTESRAHWHLQNFLFSLYPSWGDREALLKSPELLGSIEDDETCEHARACLYSAPRLFRAPGGFKVAVCHIKRSPNFYTSGSDMLMRFSEADYTVMERVLSMMRDWYGEYFEVLGSWIEKGLADGFSVTEGVTLIEQFFSFSLCRDTHFLPALLNRDFKALQHILTLLRRAEIHDVLDKNRFAVIVRLKRFDDVLPNDKAVMRLYAHFYARVQQFPAEDIARWVTALQGCDAGRRAKRCHVISVLPVGGIWQVDQIFDLDMASLVAAEEFIATIQANTSLEKLKRNQAFSIYMNLITSRDVDEASSIGRSLAVVLLTNPLTCLEFLQFNNWLQKVFSRFLYGAETMRSFYREDASDLTPEQWCNCIRVLNAELGTQVRDGLFFALWCDALSLASKFHFDPVYFKALPLLGVVFWGCDQFFCQRQHDGTNSVSRALERAAGIMAAIEKLYQSSSRHMSRSFWAKQVETIASDIKDSSQGDMSVVWNERYLGATILDRLSLCCRRVCDQVDSYREKGVSFSAEEIDRLLEAGIAAPRTYAGITSSFPQVLGEIVRDKKASSRGRHVVVLFAPTRLPGAAAPAGGAGQSRLYMP